MSPPPSAARHRRGVRPRRPAAAAAACAAAALPGAPGAAAEAVGPCQAPPPSAARHRRGTRLRRPAAAALANSGWPAAGAPGGEQWEVWSQAWRPLGQAVLAGFERNLQACPEGAVAALLHSLAALDKEEGDAATLQVVKLLFHLLGAGSLPPLPELDPPSGVAAAPPAPAATATPWQRRWLLAVASLVRFAYLKWVNVPQDGLAGPAAAAATGGVAPAALPGLQQHHKFLFQNTVGGFVSGGVYSLEMSENSVLFSEAFAFVSFCRLHDVGLVLESGVYKGLSTELWSLFVDEVVAVDLFTPPEAENRLAKNPKVRLLQGDGRAQLPRLLDARPAARAAVFIDGPKGELAIRLALSLRERPQVAFVALHDMAPYRQELRRLGAFFFSDEAWFQAAYVHLDAPFRARPNLEAGGTMAFLA